MMIFHDHTFTDIIILFYQGLLTASQLDLWACCPLVRLNFFSPSSDWNFSHSTELGSVISNYVAHPRLFCLLGDEVMLISLFCSPTWICLQANISTRRWPQCFSLVWGVSMTSGTKRLFLNLIYVFGSDWLIRSSQQNQSALWVLSFLSDAVIYLCWRNGFWSLWTLWQSVPFGFSSTWSLSGVTVVGRPWFLLQVERLVQQPGKVSPLLSIPHKIG